MALTILDATTKTNCYAATDQNEQLLALIDPWAGGNVTVRILNGTTLLDSTTYGAWSINSDTSPYELTLGSKGARVFSSTGTPTKVVFRAGVTDIFELTAGIGSGDLSAAANVTEFSDTNLAGLTITANATLPVPAAPSWTDITVGTWIQIPGSSTLQSIDPKDNPAVNPSYPGAAPWDGAGSAFAYSVTAWASICFDESRGLGFQTAQGGHNDYYGNGVYKWSLNRANPLWSVVRNPSNLSSYAIGDPGSTDATYSDGTPRSNHGYNSCVYIPGVGPAQAGLEGVTNDGRLGTLAVVKWNETTGAATFLTSHAGSGASTGLAACYDPSRHCIWQRKQGTSLIHRYDIATDTWLSTGSQSAQSLAGQVSLTYIPGHDVILVGEGDNFGTAGAARQTTAGGFLVFDCAAQTYHTPTFTGAPALGVAHTGGAWPGKTQPRWVPGLNAACMWDNATSRTLVITITPPGANPKTNAWTIGTITVDGSNAITPSAASANGTYGRFAYWEGAKGFVLLNAWNETGYFFKAHV